MLRQFSTALYELPKILLGFINILFFAAFNVIASGGIGYLIFGYLPRIFRDLIIFFEKYTKFVNSIYFHLIIMALVVISIYKLKNKIFFVEFSQHIIRKLIEFLIISYGIAGLLAFMFTFNDDIYNRFVFSTFPLVYYTYLLLQFVILKKINNNITPNIFLNYKLGGLEYLASIYSLSFFGITLFLQSGMKDPDGTIFAFQSANNMAYAMIIYFILIFFKSFLDPFLILGESWSEGENVKK